MLSLCGEPRLRVLPNAKDPLNLIQVMLAKETACHGFRFARISCQKLIMIATKDSFEPHSSEALPNSKKVYLPGQLHPDIRVPFREIDAQPNQIARWPRPGQRARAGL